MIHLDKLDRELINSHPFVVLVHCPYGVDTTEVNSVWQHAVDAKEQAEYLHYCGRTTAKSYTQRGAKQTLYKEYARHYGK